MSKRILFFILLSWLTATVCPAYAQQKPDTTYTFRFVPQKDMFFVPWHGNDKELARLLECVENHKAGILDGRMPLYVDGYCNSSGSEAASLATAKIRSNRVKSELIVRCGIKEESFITKNHADGGNFVTVRLTVPAGNTGVSGEEDAQRKAEEERLAIERADCEQQAAEKRCKAEEARLSAEEARLAAETTEAEKIAREQAEADRLIQEPAAREAQRQDTTAVTPPDSKPPTASHFALRANLLRWATLTPDLGIEWRVNRSWGILVNGSWTSWTWNDKDRRYALWEVAPEVRYYIGKEKRGYLGAMFKAGSFNYKLSGTGRQGDIMGGGLTGGYLLRLNNALALDLSIALGYLNADYEKYTVIDSVRVRQGNGTKNWWGPVNAGVTLVWTIF